MADKISTYSFIKNTLKALQDGNTYIQSATKFNSNFNGNDLYLHCRFFTWTNVWICFLTVFTKHLISTYFLTVQCKLKPGVADISKHAGKTVEPGMVKYKDIDGDGVITPDDRTTIGNGQPGLVRRYHQHLQLQKH